MRSAIISICSALLLVWVTVSHAQVLSDGSTDFEGWNSLAIVAERAIDNTQFDEERLELVRESLVRFRAHFNANRTANAARVANLNQQIEALGPVPEDGEEAPEVAARRVELNENLRNLEAPQKVAEQAFVRADGLIDEIDDILRERQAEELLQLGPSPLNPVHWPTAVKDAATILVDMISAKSPMSDPGKRKEAWENLPHSLLMLAGGLVLLARGRTWAGHALDYLRRFGGRGSGVWSFLVSLLRILLPLTGLLLFTFGIRTTGLVGPKLDLLLGDIPVWGGVLLGFRWLSERLFARDGDEALIPLPDEQRRRLRFYVLLVSLLMIGRAGLDVFLEFEPVSSATAAVLAFPFVAVTALFLLFIGLELRGVKPDAGEDHSRGNSLRRIVVAVGNGLVGISVISAAMAAVGYAQAGNALLYPAIISGMLLGFVLTLQWLFADVYVLVTGKGAEGRDDLIPALTGLTLILVSLPFLALIWGARATDLSEAWSIFERGFTIGETTISPADFLLFAIIFALGYMVTRVIQNTLKTSLLPKTTLDIGAQNALTSGFGYIGIFLSALLAITGAGIDLSSLAIVAGALSVGIGFGLRTIVENFVSGIILLVGRPVSEGDWIEVGGQMGYVREISVRSTRIETFDRTDVIVPNADLVAGTVTNYTRGNTLGRLIIKVGVAYGTDTRLVSRILKEIADAQPMVLARPEPSVVFANFGADSLEFEIRMVLRDVNWIMSVKSDVNHAIAERFTEEGIEIPFAQRDIWLRNPEALHEGPRPDGAKEAEAAEDAGEAGDTEPPKPDVGDMGGDADK